MDNFYVKQQYGGYTERVPPWLNIVDKQIYLKNVPIEFLALLFRDMGLGDKLVTEEVARQVLEGLEKLAIASNRGFQETIRNFKPSSAPEDTP